MRETHVQARFFVTAAGTYALTVTTHQKGDAVSVKGAVLSDENGRALVVLGE